jgi:hypothetical protein
MERTAYGWIESGLSPNGWAKQYRDRDDGTPDRGFGSPYQGQSPGRSLAYSASYDPPPEMLGIFGAAPKSERDFLRAFLQTTDPGQQQDILNMVSPDMQSLLGMAWNYQYGTERRAVGQEMDPMRQMQLPATHPAMGMGANPDHYQIRTMEDLGLDAHDSGLGWKDQQRAMEQAAIKPGSLASQMRKGVSANPGDHSAPEMKAIIKGALAQYGVNARVSVEETGGANEIHVQQST